jgi:UDP-N-acetylmuramate--alanine ligase
MQMKIASNEVIHFVGIGGIGMSGLAQIMHNMDFMIQGSDLSQSKNIDRLRKFGIKIFIGHKRENIKKATMLVISSAIKKNNVEYLLAKKKKYLFTNVAKCLLTLFH